MEWPIVALLCLAFFSAGTCLGVLIHGMLLAGAAEDSYLAGDQDGYDRAVTDFRKLVNH